MTRVSGVLGQKLGYDNGHIFFTLILKFLCLKISYLIHYRLKNIIFYKKKSLL